MNNNLKLMHKVIIAGGGTGGHIFPAIAIANALRRIEPDIQILFVGAKGKMEMEKVPQAGYLIEGLTIKGLNRNNYFKNITLPFHLMKSWIEANKLINHFQPNAVVGVGGYASFPVLFAAQRKGIPTLIQEQNSYAGKSNRFLGKKAEKICVGYQNMDQFFPQKKVIVTGNPVRDILVKSQINKNIALNYFDLDTSKKTILIFGGSLGAQSINEAVAADLDSFTRQNIQIIWQTGKQFFETAAFQSDQLKGVKVFSFLEKMEFAYSAADVVISRAGALAIAELCLVQKPVIFVPYPFAAEDHQTSNAMALVKRDAALMVRDADVKKDLIKKVLWLLQDDKRQQILVSNMTDMAFPDADNKIAQEIFEIMNTGENKN